MSRTDVHSDEARAKAQHRKVDEKLGRARCERDESRGYIDVIVGARSDDYAGWTYDSYGPVLEVMATHGNIPDDIDFGNVPGLRLGIESIVADYLDGYTIVETLFDQPKSGIYEWDGGYAITLRFTLEPVDAKSKYVEELDELLSDKRSLPRIKEYTCDCVMCTTPKYKSFAYDRNSVKNELRDYVKEYNSGGLVDF